MTWNPLQAGITTARRQLGEVREEVAKAIRLNKFEITSHTLLVKLPCCTLYRYIY